MAWPLPSPAGKATIGGCANRRPSAAIKPLMAAPLSQSATSTFAESTGIKINLPLIQAAVVAPGSTSLPQMQAAVAVRESTLPRMRAVAVAPGSLPTKTEFTCLVSKTSEKP